MITKINACKNLIPIKCWDVYLRDNFIGKNLKQNQ